jgi:hypothetical protein
LDSRAVKTIRFKVKLIGTNLEKEVVIHHYPLDNIQNLKGWWSSRYDTSGGTSNVTVGTWDKAVADSWGVDYTSTTRTAYVSYAEWDGNEDNREYTTYNQRNWRDAVPENNRQAANDEENAYYRETDGYYYWGEDIVNGSSSNYDYYTGNFWDRRYFRYTSYHRARYTRTGTYYTATISVPSTGTWVDWEYDQQPHTPRKTVNGNHFTAKYYDNGRIHFITDASSGGQYIAGDGGTAGTNFTNNAMYIIQITSTSDKYVLGTPVITNYQSADRVVSPAFMIASQLGYLDDGTFTNQQAQNAAEHCGTYMEVVGYGEDNPEALRGKRLTGWRLPTAEEITFIAEYQYGTYTQGTTMAEVMNAQYYLTLDGTAVRIANNGPGNGTTSLYVRCVRDLTLDEIEALNGN